MSIVNVVRGAFVLSGLYLLLRDSRFRGLVERQVPQAKPILDRVVPVGQRAVDRLAEAVGVESQVDEEMDDGIAAPS